MCLGNNNKLKIHPKVMATFKTKDDLTSSQSTTLFCEVSFEFLFKICHLLWNIKKHLEEVSAKLNYELSYFVFENTSWLEIVRQKLINDNLIIIFLLLPFIKLRRMFPKLPKNNLIFFKVLIQIALFCSNCFLFEFYNVILDL